MRRRVPHIKHPRLLGHDELAIPLRLEEPGANAVDLFDGCEGGDGDFIGANADDGAVLPV